MKRTGALLALPIAPFASDKLGRRKTLFIGAIIMLAGVVLQTMSTDIVQFIASRGLSAYIAVGISMQHRLLTLRF